MRIGKYTYIVGGESSINVKKWEPSGEILIGNFCSIAGGLEIFTGGNHRTDWFTTFPFGHIYQDRFNKFNGKGHPVTNGNVVIGNNVWIGEDVTILSGVTIGDGAVVGAKSVVTKNVEPYHIVGGNPAKVIRKRFSEGVIDKLLEIKWWYWDDHIINEFSDILCSDNFEELCKKYEAFKVNRTTISS